MEKQKNSFGLETEAETKIKNGGGFCTGMFEAAGRPSKRSFFEAPSHQKMECRPFQKHIKRKKNEINSGCTAGIKGFMANKSNNRILKQGASLNGQKAKTKARDGSLPPALQLQFKIP